jgi:hypothetical protein
MPINVTCPDCFKDYSVKDSLAGKKIRCKECQGVMTVEAEAAAEDEREEFFEPPKSRASSAKSGKPAKTKKATASQGLWSEVPWKGAGIPLGIGIALFALSRVLPRGEVHACVQILTMLMTLGCGLAGFYMLARVSSRLIGDVSNEHLRSVRRLGRNSEIGGGGFVAVFASLAFVFVSVRAMILFPRQTLPWFAMMVLGTSGLIWITKYDRDAFKSPPPAPSQVRGPSSWNDQEWKQWQQDMQPTIVKPTN